MKYSFFILCLLFSIRLFAQESNIIGKPENLGPNVNSACYDYRPRISPDGKILYFTRILCPDLKGDENYLFYCNLQPDGSWSMAKRLEAPFNDGKKSIYVYWIAPDNNSMLITQEVSGGRQLYKVTKTLSGWGTPQFIDLGVKLPTTDATFTMTSDGNVLLFTYDGPGNTSGRDLYMTRLTGDKWSSPVRCGDVVNNSEGYVLGPFLASDNATLYFAGRRAGGFGSWDCYVSRRLDESWTKWSTPVNLGAEINDSGHNESFFLDAMGEFAYFCGNNQSLGGNDIYRVKLKEKIKPKPVLLVEGKLINGKTKQPMAGTVIYEFLTDGKEAGKATAYTDGKYKISLPAGFDYSILADSKGFYAVSATLEISKDTVSKTVTKDIILFPIETGETIRLNNLFFERSKYVIRPESYSELNRLVKLMQDNPNMIIELSGHTDNVGPEEPNQKLSQNRANEVKSYMISRGIKENRIKAVGYGEIRPVGDNNTEEGRQKNRRVEFTILK